MNKPKFYRSNDKFESFLFSIMAIAVISLFSCLTDMVINDKVSSDPVAPWVVYTTMNSIYSFPIIWLVVHNIEYAKYYFKEYRPWKKETENRKEAHAARVLTVERATSELFISELRKTK